MDRDLSATAGRDDHIVSTSVANDSRNFGESDCSKQEKVGKKLLFQKKKPSKENLSLGFDFFGTAVISRSVLMTCAYTSAISSSSLMGCLALTICLLTII